jgi:hypothetical protein
MPPDCDLLAERGWLSKSNTAGANGDAAAGISTQTALRKERASNHYR